MGRNRDKSRQRNRKNLRSGPSQGRGMLSGFRFGMKRVVGSTSSKKKRPASTAEKWLNIALTVGLIGMVFYRFIWPALQN